MKKMILFFTIWSVCFLLFACVPGKKTMSPDSALPQWVHTGGIKQYPSDFFITGVGSALVERDDTAASQAQADSKAIAQVAKQIRVTINQLSSTFEREASSSSQKKVFNQRDVWERTAARVEIEIEGARIEDRYFDKVNGRVYSMAVFDRLVEGQKIADEVATLKSSALALMHEAEKSKKSIHTVHRSVSAYSLAINKILQAVRKNQYLGLIAPRMVHRDLPQIMTSLQSDVTSLISGFSIQKLSGDKQQGVIGGNLAQPFKIKFYYNSQPVPSIPISFTMLSGGGNLDRHTRTDSNGLASTFVSNLRPTGNKINKIIALLNIYPDDLKIRKALFSIIIPVEARFTYYLPAVEDIRITVLVDEYNMGRKQPQSYLANEIVRILSSAGLNLVKKIPGRIIQGNAYSGRLTDRSGIILNKLKPYADIAIIGDTASELMDGSYSNSLVFSRARAVVKIFDISSGTEIASVDMATKDAGPSRDESGRKALQKISDKAAVQVAKEIRRTLFGK